MASFAIGSTLHAQIQVDHISLKDFNATGFGGFFNFAFPVSDADYVTAELGVDYFSNGNNYVGVAPILAGFRYTIDRSGTGFYIEPNAGYSYGGTNIQGVDSFGIYSDLKISGLATGATIGYLFQPMGSIQFNIGIRYEHVFGNIGQNLFSLKIAHAFTFGRRD